MIKIKVPATSANIGPGFDCLGIALNLYNIFYFEEIDEGLKIEGCDIEFQNENNLVFTSMIECFKEINYEYKGIKIVFENNIPVSRGLGSSASCILAGVMGANELAGRKLSKEEIFKLASKIEGHPDNVAPALFGGMTTSLLTEDNAYYNKIPIIDRIKFVAFIPEFNLSTKMSREVLPNQVEFKDAVFNVGRTAFMISCFVNGKYDLLNIACKDKLHQNYRGKLIKDYDDVIDRCMGLNCNAVFLSGAGPTIISIIEKDNLTFTNSVKQVLKDLKTKWKIKELMIENQGAVVENYDD